MKFDVVVGNPPYQESDKADGKGSAVPLYNLFIDLARRLNPTYISLITPSVWFLGGKGLDKFRESMLSDTCFRSFDNFITARDVFGNVALRGGVNYFVWESTYNNRASGITVAEYKNHHEISRETRPYAIDGLNLFISDNVGFNIVDRFLSNQTLDANYIDSKRCLSSFVSERNPFGYATTFKLFEEQKDDNSQYKVYRSGGKIGFVSKQTLHKGFKLVDKVKIITPFANNIGTDLPDDNLNTQVIGKDEIVTETFLVIGADLNLTSKTASYLEKYLRTNFVRYLISLAKANQNGTRQTYRFVPTPDFNSNALEWDGSVDELGASLFANYAITENEQMYINTRIRDMQ